jgi:DNA-binding beta-propeller fold protein YncE
MHTHTLSTNYKRRLGSIHHSFAVLAATAGFASVATLGHAQLGPGVVQPTFTAAEVGTAVFNFNESNSGPGNLGGQPVMADFQHGWLYYVSGTEPGRTAVAKGTWINFSNPRAPVVDGSLAMTGNKPHMITFWGNNFITGLQSPTLTIHNFLNRNVVGSVNTTVGAVAYAPQPPYDFRGTNGYATTRPNLLAISSFVNPANPKLEKTVDLNQLVGFYIGGAHPIGNQLIVTASQQKGVAVLNISDPLNPKLISKLVTGNPIYLSMVYGSRVYACETNVGIRVYNFSNPNDIVEEGLVATGGNPRYVTIKEGRGYTFPGNNNLKVFDATTRAILNTYTFNGGSDFTFPLGNMLISGGSSSNNRARVIALQQNPDTQGPAVVYANPANGANGVALTARIGFSMSDHINIRSLNTTNFIVRPVGGSAIPGIYSTSHYGIVNFAPSQPLQPGTTYEVILPAGGVEDVVGNGLRAAYSATFTTRADTNTTPVINSVTSSDSTVPTGTAVTFTTNASDADTPSLEYAFDFGDGTTRAFATSNTANKTYAAPGRYTVIARVRDNATTVTSTITQIVHTPITTPRPTRSSSIVYDPAQVKVWNVNPDHGSVTRFNANDLVREGIHSVGAVSSNPRYLAVHPGASEIWVSCSGSGEIRILDSTTGAAIATIPLGSSSRPAGLAFSPDGANVFVALESDGTLKKINPATRAVVATLPLARGIRAVSVASGGDRVLVTQFTTPFANATSDAGRVYDVATGALTLTRTINLPFVTTADSEISGRGVPNYLTDAAISPDGTRVWVPAKKDNTARGERRDGKALTHDNTVRTQISQIDLGTNTEVAADRIDVNDQGFAAAFIFSPLGDIAFGSYILNNEVIAFDSVTGNRVTTKLVGAAPDGLAIRPNGARLWVHNFLDRTVTALDTTALLNGTAGTMPTVATTATVTTEPLSAQVLQGKKIFYNARDPRMSLEGYMSCASCHLDGDQDARVWDFSDRGEGFRNTTDLRGHAGLGQGPVHWTGNFNEIQDFELDIRGGTVNNEKTGFGGSGFIASGAPNPSLGASNAGRSADLDALAAYVASLNKTPPSPLRNADGTLTASALAGRAHFTALDCQSCHGGDEFTDSALNVFHNVGTIKPTSGTRLGAALAGFDTPTLRGIWATAPYLHDGSALTLAAVFNTTNAPAGTAHANFRTLSAAQQTELLDYLRQIDDREPAPGGGGGGAGVPTNGLVNHWPLNGNANDAVGARNGTVSGATFITGKFGQAASFDGGDHIDVGTLNFGGAFTLSTWVWINSGATNIQTILANSASGATSNGLRLSVNTFNTADGKVSLETGNGTAGNSAGTAVGAVNFGTWNHVAIAVNRTAGTAAIYVNGANVTVDGSIRTDFANNANTDFGQMTNGSFRLNGRLDQIRLYNRVLTAAEVSQLASE